MELLESHSKRPGNKPGKKAFRSWVHTKCAEYLKTTPVANQTSAQARQFMLALKALPEGKIYKEMTKADKLQILNIQPQEESTLHAIVEEYETRFNDADTEVIQGLVMGYFGDTTENNDGDDAPSDDE